MNHNPQRGFTLIELAIVIALLGVLLAMAMPALRDWIANTRIRTAAEGVLNGLQLARAEAVRQNTLVDLQIGSDGITWNVVAGGATLQSREADTGGGIVATTSFTPVGTTVVQTTTGASTVSFNGQGRMVSHSTFAAKYTSTVSGTRSMCAAVVSNTPKLCDPQRTDITDPQGCFISGTLIAGC